MSSSRIANLDTLRAIAILLVIILHALQSQFQHHSFLSELSGGGFLGVDLFFALSGFLIGSLYFSERQKNGTVSIPKFILRRVLRTVPPYLIALILSFVAVYIVRNQAFDLGYLLFIQNYYSQIPFFLVSWSLCVEEHFYLFLPFVLASIFSQIKTASTKFVWVLFIMSLVPLMFRFGYRNLDEVINSTGFGFYQTATHLRLDPLILGVMMSYISVYLKPVLLKMMPYRSVVYLLTTLLVSTFMLWPVSWMYDLGRYLIGFGFAITVVLASQDQCWRLSRVKVIPLIAVSSYAIYLTHVLVRHSSESLFMQIGITSSIFQFSAIIIATLVIGYLFYYMIEIPLMRWRNKRAPSYRH